MKIKGLSSLIKNYIDGNDLTQEIFGGYLNISLSKMKSIIRTQEVNRIDILLSLYKYLGEPLKDLVSKSTEGQNIDQLVLEPIVPYTTDVLEHDQKILTQILEENKKQTALLKQLLQRT